MKSFYFPGYQFYILLIIPVLIFFLTRSNYKQIPLYLLFAVQFFKGPIEYANLTSPNMINLFSDIIVLWLFGISYVNNVVFKNKSLKNAGLGILFFLYLATFFSFLFNNTSIVEIILFVRRVSIIPILYLCFYTTKIYNDENFRKFVIVLMLIQPLASIHKLLVYGPAEEFIGTISVGEGSLTTMLGLIAIGYAAINYFLTRKNKYLIVGVLFLIFIISGGKRAPLFFIPVLFTLILFILNKFAKRRALYPIKQQIRLLVLCFFAVFAILVFDTTLNPERKSMGDIEHMVDYVYSYLTYQGKGGVEGYGRLVAPSAVFNRLLDAGKTNLIFGLGPGILIPSSLKKSPYGTDKEILIYQYNIGYGGRIGYLWLSFQIGLLGTIIYFLFYLKFFRITCKNLRSVLTNIRWVGDFEQIALYMSLVTFFVFFIDFFSYSQVMFKTNAVALLAGYIIAQSNFQYFAHKARFFKPSKNIERKKITLNRHPSVNNAG